MNVSHLENIRRPKKAARNKLPTSKQSIGQPQKRLTDDMEAEY